MESLAVFLVALLVYLMRIDHPPQYDELYHILAARSWAADGTLSIAEGEYTRAAFFTQLTGLVFQLFGDGVVTARVLPAVFGAALVASVFLWTRTKVGAAEAWIAAVLLAFSVTTISLAHFARFYTLHAWVFFLAVICTYALVEDEARGYATRALLAAAAALLLALAFHLQVTTLVGIAALGTWVLLTLGRRARTWEVRRWAVIAVAVAAVALLLAALAGPEAIASMWARYRGQALWADGSSVLSYHWLLLDAYPVFYGLAPAILALALVRSPRFGLLCATVFVVGLIIHSFAGMRGIRYIFYLMPFFFVACAIAGAAALPHLRALGGAVAAAILGRAPSRRAELLAASGVVAASVLILLASTPALYRSANVLARGASHLHPSYAVSWESARPDLLERSAQAGVVVTTNSLSALYFLGDYDVEMSATILNETPSGIEFDRDRRTGRPVISSLESLRLLMDCHPTGLVVAEEWQWSSNIFGVPPEAAALLVSAAEPIPLPARSGLVAYQWDSPAARNGLECPNLTRLHDSSH